MYKRQVVSSVKEERDGSEKVFEMPKTCPVCGHKVVREEGLSLIHIYVISKSINSVKNRKEVPMKKEINYDDDFEFEYGSYDE